MIKCNFGMVWFDTIMRIGGEELSKYHELSKEKRIEVISKFWANLVKFVLLNKFENTYWREADAKEKEFFSSMQEAIILKGKKQADEAYLILNVSYNQALSVAEIVPYVIAKDESTKERLLDKVSQQLILVEKFLARNLTEELAIKYCFETLYGEKLCSVRGDEAVTMYKIMMRAIKHYPEFAKLDKDDQYEVLRKGFARGRIINARERDMYTFARATFEVMEKLGLTRFVYKYDPNLNKYKTYERCGASPHRIPHSICPRFIMYKFGTASGVEIRTSFMPFDLWEMLIKSDLSNVRA